MDRSYVVASGRGTVFSHLTHHAPRLPGYDVPVVIALVELEEGPRLVAQVGTRRRDRRRRRGRVPPRRRRPHPPDLEKNVTALEPWSLEVTPTFVVSTALATRDWTEVHHDRDYAQARGSQDVFVNILTSQALVQKYVEDGLAASTWRSTYDRRTARRSGVPRRHDGVHRRPGRPTVTVTAAVPLGSTHLGDGEAAVSGLSGSAAIVGHRRDRVLQGLRALGAAALVRGHAGGARRRGSDAADVDGLTTFTMDSTSEIALARELGMGDLRFFSRINYGGGAACATVQQAAMAVATGVAEVVVCYRGFNERSGKRFGQVSSAAATQVNTNGLDNAWTYPHGLSTPAATVAMQARRYLHEYGATSADFGVVAVADRKHAATNPDAFFYERPITLEDHQSSRMIADPLRLLDCCQESDGAVAIVVTAPSARRTSPSPAVSITAAAQGSAPDQYVMTSYYREDIGVPEMGVVGRELWRQSGLGPDDIDTAVLYDHFTPYVLMQLEELGFCGRGEAPGFIADGAIELGGRLPLNTHGGQLGEAYIHGMNGINEAVRQLRGTSVNQVAGAEHVLVTAGTGVPTSGLILSR